MVTSKVIWILFLVSAVGDIGGFVKSTDVGSPSRCRFPAIYNFGDSNSDTGARSAALIQVPPPNGETFFGLPSGRLCDGRLIIDFIGILALSIRFLTFSRSIKALFFSSILLPAQSYNQMLKYLCQSAGGASILPGGYSLFHLGIQIFQFIQFKSRSTMLYKQLSQSRTIPLLKSSLPRPEEFQGALYTFDIGQNDIAYGLQHTTEAETLACIPKIVDGFSEAVRQLHEAGAITFWVHNTGPIGCLPYSAIYYEPKAHHVDQNGCVKPHNKVAREFNSQLEQRVVQLRAQLPCAAFTYVDMYTAKYTFISNSKNHGFENPLAFCCGSYYGYHIDCGKKAIVNGKVYGNPCHNPSRHISWDGIHYSEAANLLLSELIFNGSLSNPTVSIHEACHHTPSN